MQRAERYNRPGLQSAASRAPLLSRDLSPALNLDFASGVLDPRIDFQRTTVGTFYRGAFNQNLVTYSQQLNVSLPWVSNSGGGGSAANPVVTTTSEPAPDGTATAFRVTFNKTGGTFSRLEHALSVGVVGRTYTMSVWLKANTANGAAATQNVGIRIGNDPSGFNCVVTTSWQRFSYSYTVAATATNAQVMLWDSITGNDETADVFVWGAQLTEGSLLTPYIPTTTAAITEGQIASSQPWNLLLQSQAFDNTTSWANSISGTGVNTVRTANNAVAPDGTTTADTITFNTAAGTTASDQSAIEQFGIPLVSGRQYATSIWMRGTVGGEQITIRGGGPNYSLLTLTTSWQRFVITGTNAGNQQLQIGIRQAVLGTINSTATVELWGAQINEGTAALDYRSTTSSALWLPRFENDPVTGEARGLLIEGGATNLLQQSAAVRTSPWSIANLTTAGTSITAPDGTANGVELVWTSGTAIGAGYTFQQAAVSASTAYTMSVYLKPKGINVNTALYIQARASTTSLGYMTVSFVHTSGNMGVVTNGPFTSTSATSTNVGNGWYRVTVTGTSPATADSIRFFIVNVNTGNGTDGVYAWGAQVEAQSFASSYIPTVAATVARGADSAVMTGTNFSSWYNQNEGTMLAKWRQWNVGVNEFAIAARCAVSSGTSNSLWIGKQNAAGTGRRIEFEIRDSSGVQRVQSVVTNVTAPVITAAGAQRFGDSLGMSYNGIATVSAAQTRTPAPDRLYIGSYDLTAGYINSTISRLAYWPTRLPDVTLQSLTT